MTMKRSYPGEVEYSIRKLPELPKLRDSIILDFFTHESIRMPGSAPPLYGDFARLEELGRHALEMAVTDTLFNLKDPMLDVSDIADHRDAIMSDQTLASWADMYGLRRKVRCLPEVAKSLNTPKENRKLFTAYVGVLFWQDGPRVVQPWIQLLILPNGSGEVRGCTVEPEFPAVKRVKTEPDDLQVPSEMSGTSVLPPRFTSAQPGRPRSAAPTTLPGPRAASSSLLHNQPQSVVVPSSDRILVPSPPIQQTTVPPSHPVSSPNPMPMAASSQPFLPHFNEMAQRRNIILNYECSSNGPLDQDLTGARWTAVCNVSGIPKGTGYGSTKQDAKEEAARQAFYSLGWAPPAVREF